MLYKYLTFIVSLTAFSFVNAQTADFSATLTTVCVGVPVQFTDLSTGAVTYSWTFPDGGAGQTSTVPNPLITYNTPGTFDVTLTVSNGANSDTELKPGYITVISAATAVLSSAPGTDNQNICQGSLITQIAYNVTGATGADFSGLPSFATGAFTPTVTGGTMTVSGLASTPGSFPYSITTTGPGCTPITVTGLIVVNATTSLTVTSGLPNALVCVNNAMTDIVFSVGGSPTSVVAAGLPAGVTGTLVGSTFTISGTPTTTGIFNYSITASGGGCPQVQYNGGIAVDPDIQLASAPGSNNQSLCTNSPLGNIVYTLGPSITGATITGLPAGVTGVFNPGQFLISNTPTAAGVYNYTITTSGGSCGPATATGTITVTAAPTLTLDVPGTNIQTMCEGTPINTFTYSIGGSATFAGTTGLPLGITEVFSSGTLTLSGSPTQTGVFNFTVFTSGSPCGSLNLFGTITVDQIPQLNLVSTPGSDSLQACLNIPIDTVIFAVTGTATNITAVNLPAGFNSITQGDSIKIFGTPSAFGTFPYTVFTSGGTCPADTVYGQITVANGPVVNIVSFPGSDSQILCTGDPLDTIVYVVSGAATNAYAIGLPAGVTAVFSNDTLFITGTPLSTATSNYAVIATGGTCPNDTLVGGIYVISPVLSLASSVGTDDQEICINTSISPIVYSVIGIASSISAIGLPPGVSASAFNDTLTIIGTPTLAGTYNYTVFTIGSPCPDDTIYGTISVSALPVVLLTSAPGTNNQSLCVGDGLDPIEYTISGGADTVVVIGLPAGISGVFSGGNLTIFGTLTGTVSANYTVIASGGNCPNDTLFGSITVNSPNISLVSPAGSNLQQVCVGTPINPIIYVFSNGATGANALNLPPGVTAVVQNDSLIISGTPTITGNFLYSAHTSGSPCQADTSYGVITVNPATLITLASVAGTDAQTVDEDETITTIAYLLNGASGANVTGLPAGVNFNVIGDTVYIFGAPTTAGTYPYSVTATGSCPVTPAAGNIEVVVIPPPPSDTLDLFVPNLFSPNEDGKNDKWEIINLDQYTESTVLIINREGQIVFEDIDYKNTWDGTYNGDPLPEATYYYVLKYDNGEKVLKGAVSILRNEK
jgi:gliding motility-associated-like protein